MSGKRAKLIRRTVKAQLRGDFKGLFNAMCDQGFFYRLHAAACIMFKIKAKP